MVGSKSIDLWLAAAGNTPSGLTIAGGIVTAAGACTSVGSSGAIQNGTSPQTAANFNIGFTLNFGTAAPASAAVDWVVVR